jgi:hypothetical protein
MRGARLLAGVVVLLLTAAAGAQASNPLAPTPIGSGARYHPGPRGPLLAANPAIAGLGCSRSDERRVGAHLELFARGLVVLVPAGIGVAPPLHADGAGGTKISGGCSFPARTREPTGVVEVVPHPGMALGDFFTLWGQPLASRRLAGFRAVGGERVRAWVNGRYWPGELRSIPLLRHTEIVLELGRFIPPHASYRFEKGL